MALVYSKDVSIFSYYENSNVNKPEGPSNDTLEE